MRKTTEQAYAKINLCLDVTGRRENGYHEIDGVMQSVTLCDEIAVSFEESDCFAWLCENAHKYGYILRYPKGKEHITKYDYEPWHYRFVGVDAARVIYEDKICLEEYLARY